MRSISIRIRGIVSGIDTLLLLLLDIGLGELNKFLTCSIHPRVVLITIFVANSTLDMLPPYIKMTLLAYSTFYPSHFELASLNIEKQSSVWFFPSQVSSPHCYGYLEEVSLCLTSPTFLPFVQVS
jgi:hypothetical protein